MIDVILAVIGGGGGAYGGGTEIKNIRQVEISYIGKYIEYPLKNIPPKRILGKILPLDLNMYSKKCCKMINMHWICVMICNEIFDTYTYCDVLNV